LHRSEPGSKTRFGIGRNVRIDAQSSPPFSEAPMQVDSTTVKRIARLARIKITDEEAKGLEKELTGILQWVEQLDAVDTKNVEPMTRVVPIALKQRDDKVTDGEIADQVTANAPMTEDHFYVVPKVVE
jgi:aspartyl-tRNA(Asn)/glutamyl-tRNA(Gln) amidotransferase subunit C